MTPRLTSAMLVSSLMRRVSAEGGNAAIIARGDDSAGAILLLCSERGRVQGVRERVLGSDGIYVWRPVGPVDSEAEENSGDYVRGRLRNDPDLWVVELDIAGVERFVL